MSKQEPIRLDSNFRPNHRRSITISGVIDDALVARVLPEIVRLQSISRNPITVYIDSPGGDIECARVILQALRSSDQDQSPPCRLISVALSEASSAASDLLMAADYALAYPYSRILCHGTRIRPSSSFTKDQAADYARYMAGQDEGFALTLATNCIETFMFRISNALLASGDSNELEKDSSGNFSPTAEGIAKQYCSYLRANGLVRESLLEQLGIAGTEVSNILTFASDAGLSDAADRPGAIRSALLKDALENKASSLNFGNLESQFQLLSDFFEQHHMDMIEGLNDRWFADVTSIRDNPAISPVPVAEGSVAIGLVWMRCFSIWFLFVFFCRQLQTGDFPMIATEAYWLGLIDEVIGLDLPSPRRLVENAPVIPFESPEGAQP